MYEYQYTVGPNDVNEQYKHVHHAHSLRYLEQARGQFLIDIGCSNEHLISTGIFPVVSRIAIAYRRELFEGSIRVTCERLEAKGRELLVMQRIFNHKGKEAISAEVGVMFMDGKTRRAIQIPPRISCYIQPTTSDS